MQECAVIDNHYLIVAGKNEELSGITHAQIDDLADCEDLKFFIFHGEQAKHNALIKFSTLSNKLMLDRFDKFF